MHAIAPPPAGITDDSESAPSAGAVAEASEATSADTGSG